MKGTHNGNEKGKQGDRERKGSNQMQIPSRHQSQRVTHRGTAIRTKRRDKRPTKNGHLMGLRPRDWRELRRGCPPICRKSKLGRSVVHLNLPRWGGSSVLYQLGRATRLDNSPSGKAVPVQSGLGTTSTNKREKI